MVKELICETVVYREAKPELMRFRNANRELHRNERYFDWRYLGGTDGREPVIIFARDAAGRLVGSLSVIPRSYWIGNRVGSVGVVGDISVDPTWRGQGVGGRMAEHAATEEAFRSLSLAMVLPNAPAARIYEKAGWQTCRVINRFKRVLRIDGLLKHRGYPDLVASALAGVGEPLLKVMFSPDSPFGSAITEMSVGRSVDTRFDELWDRAGKAECVMAVRDRKHLTWRYIDHPSVSYEFFTLQARGVLQGYIAFHAEGDTCYIDDVFCDGGQRVAQYLLACFVANRRECSKALWISARLTDDGVWERVLARNAFVRRADNQRVMIGRTAECEGGSGGLPLTHRWLVTAGDKDV